MSDSAITLEYKGRVAVVTIDNEKKLNALNQQQYYEIAQKLREVATHDEVYVTVLLAKGRFFSAFVTRHSSPVAYSPSPITSHLSPATAESYLPTRRSY